jgi:hypothetical protein
MVPTIAVVLLVGFWVSTRGEDCGPPGSATDMSKDPPYKDYVKAWTNSAGCKVRRDIVALRYNSCTAADIREILIGTPLGNPTTPETTRVYVRDPSGGYGSAPLGARVALPSGAVDSGYRFGAQQLWSVPADDAYLYVVSADVVEAWPKGLGPTCA